MFNWIVRFSLRNRPLVLALAAILIPEGGIVGEIKKLIAKAAAPAG